VGALRSMTKDGRSGMRLIMPILSSCGAGAIRRKYDRRSKMKNAPQRTLRGVWYQSELWEPQLTMNSVAPLHSGKQIWRQAIAVRGDSLRLLDSVSNIAAARRDPESNTLIIQGEGVWFPSMHGLSWVAACTQRQSADISLSDISPILRVLLDATPIPMSEAPRAEIAAWLRGEAR
jgi:hypothetical protein